MHCNFNVPCTKHSLESITRDMNSLWRKVASNHSTNIIRNTLYSMLQHLNVKRQKMFDDTVLQFYSVVEMLFGADINCLYLQGMQLIFTPRSHI